MSSKPTAAETISERIPYSGSTENLSIKSNVHETPVSSKPNKGTYKLSLCKSTTEAMTRKRMHSQQKKLSMQPKRLKLELKFDEIQTEESDSTQNESDTKSTSDECGKTNGPNTPPHSNSSLQDDIDELTKKITSIEKHQQRTSELEALKMKWLEAGRKVIEEIKEKIEEDEDVFLVHFQIDPGLFNLNSSE